jgi:hypothetical protein
MLSYQQKAHIYVNIHETSCVFWFIPHSQQPIKVVASHKPEKFGGFFLIISCDSLKVFT